MSFRFGKKPSKQKQIVNKTMALLQGLQKLEEAGALHMNKQDREVHLLRELFWDQKPFTWKQNFTNNLHVMMDRHLDKYSDDPIHLYAIDIEKKCRGVYLTSYLPDLKSCKVILKGSEIINH